MAEEYKNAPEEFKKETTPNIDTTEEPSAETGEVKSRGMFDFLKPKEEVKPQETTTTTTPIESEFKKETTPKIDTTEEPSAETGEVKSRGMFDFLKKKEEVKPQETTTTTTPIESEFEHKAQISDPPPFKQEEGEVLKPTLLEQLHQKHEEEKKNNPSLLHKLHRSNSSSSSSSDEEGEDGVKRKKENKKTIVMEPEQVEKTKEEDKEKLMDKIKEKFPHGTKTENDAPVVNTVPVVHAEPETAEKKGVVGKIKEKLPGHSKKPEDSHVVNTEAVVPPPVTEKPAEKKGIMEKIKEKLPGHHAKEEKKEYETHA